MHTRKMPASERPKVFYEYQVKGHGSFPIDMLRYDSAWPAKQEEIHLLDSMHLKSRIVTLRSYSEPTPARWNSFGWSVV